MVEKTATRQGGSKFSKDETRSQCCFEN